MNKTLKVAALGAAMIASVGAFTVLATPGVARATNNVCNANPSMSDFSAAYAAGSVTKAHVAYTAELPLCEGVTQVFSLNSYATEGDRWETSGTQALVDHDTVTLSAAKTEAELNVELPGEDCFFQTDLYANAKLYDGVDGPLPHYPDTEAPEDFIDARTGGVEVCEGGEGGGTPEEPATPETPSTPATLPAVGAGLESMIALGAGMVGGAATYLRARRAR